MTENCLICGKDHPGKLRGGKVSGVPNCFKPARQPLRDGRRLLCECGMVATHSHRAICDVWHRR